MSSGLWQVQGSVISGLNIQIQDNPELLHGFQQLVEGKIGIPSIKLEEECFSSCKVWCYMVADQYLVDVFVPVVWIIFTQFLKSWFEVFVEYF